MNRSDVRRAALLLDGVACAATAVAVAAVPALVRPVSPQLRARVPIAVALVVTAAVAAIGGIRRRPSRRAMTAAAIANAVWVAVSLIALRRQSGPGRVLIAATAIFDAVAGTVQLVLRDDRDG